MNLSTIISWGSKLFTPKSLGAVAITGVLMYGGKLVFNIYDNTMTRIDNLGKTNAALAEQRAQDRLVLDLQQEEIERAKADAVELRRVAQQASSEVRRLQDVFANTDFEDLARNRPEAIERRVNAGTERMLALLECASRGSAGTDGTGCGSDGEARGTTAVESDEFPLVGPDAG